MAFTTSLLDNKQAGIQTKLTIGQPNDKYEQEADAMADQVMRMSQNESPIQRKCEECEEEELQMKPISESITPFIQMEPLEEEEAIVQAKPEGGSLNTSASLSNQLNRSKGGGSGLPNGTNQYMSNAFGTDFSNVRVHTDSKAVQMNRSLGARAFTHGNDVYFNKGEYSPSSGKGKHLLAHELTHVVQQNGASPLIQRLTVSGVGNFHKGACGEYSKSWKFELNAPAPSDGYMVQQLDFYEDLKDCPMNATCPVSPKETFWEAWKFNQGDTLFSQFSRFNKSDVSSYPAKPGMSGYVNAFGTIKFFPLSKTGDLGDLNTAPSTPNGGWGPGANPQSHSLPSTNTIPPWWNDAPIEGPATRFARAAWKCCNSSDDFNTITANP